MSTTNQNADKKDLSSNLNTQSKQNAGDLKDKKSFPEHHDHIHYTNIDYYKDVKENIDKDIGRMESEGPTSSNKNIDNNANINKDI
jgi:hypothetical protein